MFSVNSTKGLYLCRDFPELLKALFFNCGLANRKCILKYNSIMNNIAKKFFSITAFLAILNTISAQSSSGSNNNLLLYSLAAAAVLILFFFVVQVSDNLLSIEAKQMGVDKDGRNFSIFPSLGELFSPRLPDYTINQNVKVFKQGFDIQLEGKAESAVDESARANTFAIQPPNFLGISPIPKMLVEVGAEVKAGDELFFDKKHPSIKHVAPVSGEVIAVNRGEKRSIVEVVILADKEIRYREFPTFNLEQSSREELVEYLLDSGVWPLFKQRPFNVIPSSEDRPRDIFVSTFDTAPLAPDTNLIVEGREVAFQKGLDVLAKLTEGKVYLGLDANGESAPADVFTKANNVEINWFKGKHPSGNVGVQIHHVKPINAGEKVWTLGIQEVITVGQLFLEQKFDAKRGIVVAGSEIKNPIYVDTYLGANIGDLVKTKLSDSKVRLISGDVLSGQEKGLGNFLNVFDDQVTAIEEGDYYEMFGWLFPSIPKPSMSRTYPNFLFPDLKFKGDTNTHGEKRAFVVTGQYEKVMPMDIYVQHLMKSIMINDIEKMEGLGIYEVVEEDVALCEFVCTSKQPLQRF